MIKRIFLSLATLTAFFLSASAQELDWNVDFEYFFHNTEFDRSHRVSSFSESSNAARLTPAVGVRFNPHGNFSQRIMLGVDVVRDMGYGVRNAELIGDLTLYYDAELAFRDKSVFSFVAGAFPRSFAEGDYRRMFWDYDSCFYDPNFEGFFVKYRSQSFYAELGLDWFGKMIIPEGPWNRDHFQLVSSGRWQLSKPLGLGWIAKGVHYADFNDIERLADQYLLKAWAIWSPHIRGLDAFEAETAFIASYQADRGAGVIAFPCGAQLRQKASRSGLGVENFLYAGADLQPYRDSYPADLYPSDKAYHIPARAGASATLGWNDELQIFYGPEIARGLHLAFTLGFQFGNRLDWISPEDGRLLAIPVYRGCRQMISLRADFGKPRKAVRAVQERSPREGERNPFEEFLQRLYEL